MGDIERQRYLRSIRSIVVRVAVVCAGLVLSGALLAALYVWWQTTPGQLSEASSSEDIRISFDPAKLVLAGVVVAVLAIVAGAVAAWFIARSAIRPLEETARVQRRFVADASHELRTPLTVMSARAQQLSALVPADQRARAVADELREDVRIMSGIVDDMLEAARDEPVLSGRAALAGELMRVTQDLELVARERSIGIAITDEVPDAVVAVPAPRLRRMLTALVDNALAHSPEGSLVRVAFSVQRETVHITVTDRGRGITGIAPERVFDRFAHGDPPVDEGRTSHGIGLSLVREVAQSHGGSVRVVRTGPEGTQLELRLPLASAEEA